MKKVLLGLLLLVGLGFNSCSDEELMVEEAVVTCESIDVEYTKLIVDLALENGWEPQEYTFNSTTIGEDFLNPYADENFQIFLYAYGVYAQDWVNAKNLQGCF